MAIKNEIVEIKNLAIGYHGKGKKYRSVYRNINLEAARGEMIALVGENGIGKSTLLRTLARLQEKSAGSIRFRGKEQHLYSRRDYARLVSFVSTEIVNVHNLKVFDLVALGRFPHTNWLGKLNEHDRSLVIESLNLVGMNHMAQKNVSEISDGERQRVMIARTLAQDTPVIILDEPTAFLDLPNKYELIQLLSTLADEENKTVIFSIHDLNIALHQADKIWLMHPDRIISGAPEDLILNNVFDDLFPKSRLHFDKRKGDYLFRKKITSCISLEGKGLKHYWTKKALERIHYKVVEKSNDMHLVVGEQKDEPWTLYKNGTKFEFISLYDVTLFLKKLINH